MSAFARIVMFVMPGENPDPKKTAETLATITGSRVTIMEIKPYDVQANPNNSDIGKRYIRKLFYRANFVSHIQSYIFTEVWWLHESNNMVLVHWSTLTR